MPSYTSISLASAISRLASRLNDSSNVHWTQTELQNAITESLRIFQTLTGFYRDRISIATVANQTFYDLRTTNPTEYAFTVTDSSLLSEIQSHLLEPVANPWTGTSQFSIARIASALQRARDQYLTNTGIYVTRQTLSVSPPVGRKTLNQTVIDIRRVAWLDSISSLTYPLSRTDEYAAAGYLSAWLQATAVPNFYSIAAAPPLTIQLIPAPTSAGTLDLCLLDSGPALACTAGSPVVLGIPDDFTYAVKWLALADLLSEDGPSSDPGRAAYCRQLYALAVSVGKSPTTILQAQISNLIIQPSSISDDDGYNPVWQTTTPARPTDLLQVAPNLFALWPTPDAIYSVTADIVRSIPIPSVSVALQISSDLFDAILDMSEHIASFKSAGVEFQSTFPLRDNFLRLAAEMNSRLRANDVFNLLLSQPATRPSLETPRLMEVSS